MYTILKNLAFQQLLLTFICMFRDKNTKMRLQSFAQGSYLVEQLESIYQYLDVLIPQNKLRIHSLHVEMHNWKWAATQLLIPGWKTHFILERGTKTALPQLRKIPLSLSICKILSCSSFKLMQGIFLQLYWGRKVCMGSLIFFINLL